MISRFFIDRPIFATVLALLIVLAGLLTFSKLPVSWYPEVCPPTVVVTANYPGANAKVLAKTVASPLEEHINGVEDMLYMSGNCASNGRYQLVVTFKVGTDLDMAAVRVQNRVAQALPSLPEDVRRTGVHTSKQSTSFVTAITLSSPDGRYDDLFLCNYALLHVKNELARLEGVGAVVMYGVGDYSMRVWLNPEQLKARGLTAEEVVRAIRQQNLQVAAGQLGQPPAPAGSDFQFTINVRGMLETSREFGDIVVKSSDGAVVRLSDVAKVELGAKSYDMNSQSNGEPVVTMAIMQLPGANSLEVGQRVRAKMSELAESFPAGMKHRILYDGTRFITASIDEVMETLYIAAILVFFTLLFFLQDWRATLIPAVSIPVSLIGTFAVMGMMGFGVNTITLFGLVLAIGIVVDDAIVVVEKSSANIAEKGMQPREAALAAMKEVTAPIVAITLVLMVVFVPTAFMSGITGQIYRQFALTIAASTAFSGLNALTLSPALCALFLRRPPERRNILARAFNRCFDASHGMYGLAVGSLVRRAALVLPLYAVLAGCTYWGFINLPTGFIPTEDQGYNVIAVQLPDAASFERSLEVTEMINERLKDMPGVRDWFIIPGMSVMDGGVASNAVTGWALYKPWEERTSPELSQEAMLGRMWKEFGAIKQARIFVFPPPPIMGLGDVGGFQMMVQDRGGAGYEALQNVVHQMAHEAHTRPELHHVFSMFRANVPQLQVRVDRTKVNTLDVPLSSVFTTLQANLGSLYVNDFNRFGRNFQVRVQAQRSFRDQKSDIGSLEVRNRNGGLIPLGSLLSVKETVGPQTIGRYNVHPAASLNGRPAHGFSSGQALKAMEEVAETVLPPSMGYEWSSMSFQEKAVEGEAVVVIALSVLFVYLLLCALYESWAIPLAVILVVPLALSGTVAALILQGSEFNVYSQIGILVLIAMACKNSILIVEFARVRRQSGLPIREAAKQAAISRFRPVLMTSFPFILGVLPLVISSGAGAMARQSLGSAVFGGMIAATLLSVFFVPAFFVIIQALSERAWGRKADAQPVAALRTQGH